MSEQRPTFVARKNPGSGWGVDILWPDGETEVVKGFITDAVKWIAEHEYSKATQGNTNDKPTPNALENPNPAAQAAVSAASTSR
jgi:hypothetical protein